MVADRRALQTMAHVRQNLVVEAHSTERCPDDMMWRFERNLHGYPERDLVLAEAVHVQAWQKRSDAPASPPYSSWPLALRRVRAWLEPYVMLMRYWRAFSDLSPPPELEALLEWVFSGQGLCLYAR